MVLGAASRLVVMGLGMWFGPHGLATRAMAHRAHAAMIRTYIARRRLSSAAAGRATRTPDDTYW